MAEPNVLLPRLDAYASGTTLGVTAADGNYVYLSLRGWPNQALLKRLRIRCNTDAVSGPLDIKILSDAAAYRAAAAPVNEDYVLLAYNNEAGMGDPATTWVLDDTWSDGVYINDATQTNHLYLYIEFEGLIGAAAPTFDVEVWGESIPHREKITTYRIRDEVIWVKTVADVYTDLTLLSKRLGVYYLDPVYGFSAWSANTDYLYVGAFAYFKKVSFDIATAATAARALTAEYLDDTGTWSALTILDNTDAIPSGTATPFSFSGAVSWDMPVGWNKQVLPVADGTPPDRSTQYVADVGWSAGTGRPRYWVRFAVDFVVNNATFRSIRIIPS